MLTIITVLITCCGSGVGLGVIKALRRGSKDFRLIGVDADPYAACFYLKDDVYRLDEVYTVPKAVDPKFIPKIVSICKKENVDVIFPCTDHELLKLSLAKDKITKYGVEIIVSPPETIKICRDKWLTYSRLSKYLPLVKSVLPNRGIEEALQITGLPAVIKPRFGSGSRDIYKVLSIEEARILIKRVCEPIMQSWLEGEEYTIDGLTDKHGKALCIVPRRRIKILAGFSSQGVTLRDKKLIEIGERITKHLKIIGPFNFQVRKCNGEPFIMEINPRFSGTGILSVMAGANIPFLAVREICNMKVPSDIGFKESLFISRYIEDVFFKIDEAMSCGN